MSDAKQNADAAAEKILLPESNGKNNTFLGYTIGMRPVPVAVAKELRRLPENLSKLMDAARKGAQESTMTADDMIKIDEAAADLYLDVVYRLTTFYKVNISRDDILNKATLTEMKNFVDQQIQVQGEEDFLFRPFLGIMSMFFPEKEIEKPNPPS